MWKNEALSNALFMSLNFATLISFVDYQWQESDSPYYPQKRQYRSGIFYLNDEQRKVAETFVEKLNEEYSGAGKLYIDVEPATKFYRGEEYHQNFLAKQKSSRGLQRF